MSTEIIANLPNRDPVLRIKTLPNDANRSGDIFGGWLMSQIDIAGAIVATKKTLGHVVTVAVKDLTFLQPLFVYDLVSFYVDIEKMGKTSITVKVEVYAERLTHPGLIKVSDATLVYVAVSQPGIKREILQE
ncbi:MAG: acyl-CoA thioesterase [Gammaproteobacteria bacterium]|nr:acyl-CoA thioesterase [Gammaproteobacteria bacterium]